MRNLQRFPYWRPEHLGAAIPDSEHAVSTAMPTWRDVIDYEEGAARVCDALCAGYPRFRLHPAVTALAEGCGKHTPYRHTLPFPSASVARRCISFVRDQCRNQEDDLGSVQIGPGQLHYVSVPESAYANLFAFWRHHGEIVSSRQARHALLGTPPMSGSDQAKQRLRARLAELAGACAEDVYLFPSGMAAISTAHRAVTQLIPARPTVQLGFPYVDTLEIQKKSGPGVLFLPEGDADDLERACNLGAGGEIAAIFCECPTNPLLRVPMLPRLSSRGEAFLVVDNTLDCFDQLDLLPHTDMVVTSLTKYFSGVGDVMGGSLVLNAASPRYESLKNWLSQHYEDLLWGDDALALELYSRGYQRRMTRVNRNARTLSDLLRKDPRIQAIHHPSGQNAYDLLRKPGTVGYGGLFSIILKDPGESTVPFYDALACCKGPSLGTTYTLVSPYTQLAHYDALSWAQDLGISPWLLRVSTGEEADLAARFQTALARTPATIPA